MLQNEELCILINQFHDQPLEILKHCGGYYECPKDALGKRLGPLVGYAGRDEQGRQLIGDVYVNFAKAEEFPIVLHYCAQEISALLETRNLLDTIDVFCGAPLGGLALAYNLAFLHDKRFIYPEKKVTAVATPHSREESELIFSRHEVQKGDRVVLVDDVLNNFSTTERLVEFVYSVFGQVVAIVGFLNRSLSIDNEYTTRGRVTLPIISLVRKPTPQYRQNEPEVKEDIQKGNVVWKPKSEWSRLLGAMKIKK